MRYNDRTKGSATLLDVGLSLVRRASLNSGDRRIQGQGSASEAPGWGPRRLTPGQRQPPLLQPSRVRIAWTSEEATDDPSSTLPDGFDIRATCKLGPRSEDPTGMAKHVQKAVRSRCFEGSLLGHIGIMAPSSTLRGSQLAGGLLTRTQAASGPWCGRVRVGSPTHSDVHDPPLR